MDAVARLQRCDEIHEAFLRFPAPLALVPAEPEGDGWRTVWLRVPGSGEVTEVRARAIGARGRVVLAVEHDHP